MFRNYLLVALRNLRRNKGYASISIFGLALSLGLGLLLIQMLIVFMSFDRFHAGKDRIYRVNTTRTREGTPTDYASTPFPLASLLSRETPGVLDVAHWSSGLSGNVVCRGRVLPFHAELVDPGFFRVFSVRLRSGDPATALREPFSVILSAESARKLFGDDDPLGETLRFGTWGDYAVTGVLEDTSALKSSLPLKPMISLSTLAPLERQGLIKPWSEDWTNIDRSYAYVLLDSSGSPRAVEQAANRIASARVGTGPGTPDRFWLQPLTRIVPGRRLMNHYGEDVPWGAIFVLGAVALLVALSAAFNYTNLSFARALSRAREVGIRKVVGAKRRQLFVQFTGEAVLISLASLFAGLFLYRLLLVPLLQGLHPALAGYFRFRETWGTLAIFLGFAAGTGIVAGALPAMHISRFRPLQALRNLAGLKVVSRVTARKALIVFQFMLSMVFITSTLIMMEQLRFVRSLAPGFRPAGVLQVDLQGVDFELFRQKAAAIPGIEAVCGAESMPGVGGANRAAAFRRPGAESPLLMPVAGAEAGFLALFEIPLVAGSDFPPAAPAGGETRLILTEAAVRRLGFDSAASALDQTLETKSGTMARIIGVARDFAHRKVEQPRAVVLEHRSGPYGAAAVRVAPGAQRDVTERLRRLWTEFDSAAPFESALLTDLMELGLGGYTSMTKSIRCVALVAIIIACLGLLGIADYGSRLRRREVAIRKVCGSGEWSLVRLLSRSHLAMLGIAAGAAIPVGWFFSEVILSLFDERTPLRPETFAAGAALVGALGMAMVLAQTIRAARAHPAEVIRNE